MTHPVTYDHLKGNDFARGLPEAKWISVLPYLELLQLADHTVIYEEGDPAEAMYLIVAGKVQLSRRRCPESDWTVVAIRTSGSFFGEISLIDHGRRTVRATAIGSTRLVRVPATIFHQLLNEEGGSLARHLVRATSEFARDAHHLMLTHVMEQQRRELSQAIVSWMTQRTQDYFTGLRLNAQTLSREVHEPKAAELIQEITATVDTLVGFLQGLSAFAETTLPRPVFRQVNICEFWQRVEPAVRQALNRRGISLDVHCEEVTAQLDPDLVGAGLKYAFLGLSEIAAAGSTLIFRACCAGSGIDFLVTYSHPNLTEYAVLRLFEPFLASSPGQQYGINLALTKRYLEQAGGKATLRVRKGDQVTLAFSLPHA